MALTIRWRLAIWLRRIDIGVACVQRSCLFCHAARFGSPNRSGIL